MTRYVITALGFALLSVTGTAQSIKAWGDPHKEKFLAAAKTDPAYTAFRLKMSQLIASAKGKSTNAVAVKALVMNNRALLNKIHANTGVTNRSLIVSSPGASHMSMADRPQLINQAAILAGLQKSVTSYEEFYYNATDWNGTPPDRRPYIPDNLEGSSARLGMIVNTSSDCVSNSETYGLNYCKWGECIYSLKQKFKVPDDPQILSARLKFEYIFDYDGWDTEGAINEMHLQVEASPNFNSSTYNSMPEAFVSTGGNEIYKKAATLYARDTVKTEFKEIHVSKSGSFSMEGYVRPGEELSFSFGFGHGDMTYKGWHGSYHYGLFKLKKITITYLK